MFILFSIAYIDKQENSNINRASVITQSLRVIALVKFSKSNCLEFYHPPSKQIITCAVYKLDPKLAVVPVFNYKYDGGLLFNAYHNEADIYRKTKYDLDSTVYIHPKANESRCITTTIIGVL